METIWIRVIKFFNCHIGEIVKRQDLLKYCNPDGKNGKFTVDTYKNILEHCKYIKTVKAGRYQVLVKIPEDLRKIDALDTAYNLSTPQRVFYDMEMIHKSGELDENKKRPYN